VCHLRIGFVALATAGLALGLSIPREPPQRAREEALPQELRGRLDRFGDPLPAGALVRLGSARFRHSVEAGAVAFAPDGKTLATGGGDALVRLWDAATGGELGRFHGHVSPVVSVAFSPDGRQLAAGAADDHVRLWDLATGRLLHVWPGCFCAFASDGLTLSTIHAERARLHLWDTDTGLECWQLPGWSCSFAPDGKTLAVGGDSDTVRFHDRTTGKELRRFQGEGRAAARAMFSPDGKRLASWMH
jgi:WD40 repeat protein